MKKNILVSFFLLVALLFVHHELEAQCAMCKAVLESNMQSGEESVGKGINNGIIYIMFVPYILLGIAGFFMYRNYLRPSKAEK